MIEKQILAIRDGRNIEYHPIWYVAALFNISETEVERLEVEVAGLEAE